MSERKFLISVVMPVYNTEEYLEAAIDSLLNQAIGFKENVQLVLVNDGSTDRSGVICRRYARLYPNNIIYKKTHNHGVSAARNYGLRFATGEWVNYMDSDDRWRSDAFLEMKKFSEEHADIDVIASRIKYFDAQKDYHFLDFRFTENRVVDISEEYNDVQMHCSSCFFRRSLIQGDAFDVKMKYAEDSKYVTDAIMRSGKYAVMRTAVYFYRKRRGQNKSAMQKLGESEYYNKMLDDFHFYIANRYMDDQGALPKYAQAVIFYELSWRIFDTEHEMKDEQLEKITKLMSLVDDDIILNFFRFKAEKKYGALHMKYGAEELGRRLSIRGEKIFFDDFRLCNYVRHALEVYSMKRRGDKIEISGRVISFLPNDDMQLHLNIDGRLETVELQEMELGEISMCDGFKCRTISKFEISLPVSSNKMEFLFSIHGAPSRKLLINYGRFAKLNKYQESYYAAGDRIICASKDGLAIRVLQNSFKRLILKELRYDWRIMKNKLLRVILIRWAAIIERRLRKRPLWIISDRPRVANDNGFAFYSYLIKNGDDIDYYFAINKKSADYGKVAKIGKVVDFNSRKYKRLFLLADKIVSSQADEYVTRYEYGRREWWLRDLETFDFVFLQHGVILHDLSGWLNKINKNIALFCTQTVNEYESVINGNYAYSSKEVKLTGLARHDLLKRNDEKILLFMPTWRANIGGCFDKKQKSRLYNSEFSQTEYCIKYNKLINDKRLISAMKKYGYKGLFVVHPSHMSNNEDFIGNDTIEVVHDYANYSELFSDGALLVTDYSSVAFEMAYLRKPVIYYQFDKEQFYSEHFVKKGYFSFEDDGFGDIYTKRAGVVNGIIEYMKNDCHLRKKYKKRVEKTFRLIDNKNCERIYNEIMKLES